MNISEMTIEPRLLMWGCLVALVLYLAFFRWFSRRADRLARQRYLDARERVMQDAESALVRKDLLTPNEQEFYGRLESAAAPLGLKVVPQVAMGALLDVSLDKNHPLYWPLRRRFDKKIVDFVVYVDGSMRVLAIVELDDRTHDPEKDRVRDAMMAKGGFHTVRWDSRAKPSVQVIHQKFASLMVGVSG
jgi:hypothetical protein